jgi:hypothetical protein
MMSVKNPQVHNQADLATSEFDAEFSSDENDSETKSNNIGGVLSGAIKNKAV